MGRTSTEKHTHPRRPQFFPPPFSSFLPAAARFRSGGGVKVSGLQFHKGSKPTNRKHMQKRERPRRKISVTHFEEDLTHAPPTCPRLKSRERSISIFPNFLPFAGARTPPLNRATASPPPTTACRTTLTCTTTCSGTTTSSRRRPPLTTTLLLLRRRQCLAATGNQSGPSTSAH